MTKSYIFNQPTTIKKVKEMIDYKNDFFGSDLTINKLEETYWTVAVEKMNNKKVYFRGWSQAQENSDEGLPIWASIKNDSRIVLFTTKEQAEMFAKSISPFPIVEKYKEVEK